jgi:hypothetical protein
MERSIEVASWNMTGVNYFICRIQLLLATAGLYSGTTWSSTLTRPPWNGRGTVRSSVFCMNGPSW